MRLYLVNGESPVLLDVRAWDLHVWRDVDVVSCPLCPECRAFPFWQCECVLVDESLLYVRLYDEEVGTHICESLGAEWFACSRVDGGNDWKLETGVLDDSATVIIHCRHLAIVCRRAVPLPC